MTADEKYMKQALTQAKKALLIGEVPIGCVIVFHDREKGERVIGRGYNRRNTDQSTLSHAEMTAIKKASRALGDWRLEECTLYVTLEPCQMCAGAIVQARIPRVVIGAMNPKAGCAGSIYNLLEEPRFNHQVETERGVLEEACAAVLKRFFTDLRIRNKLNKQALQEEEWEET
ncbi:MAG: tRNA adenosine(34) deaminase TadA [Lachnospiraceae bacterium]|nr:tRNA adenosine(34) deaminase TadA [Lachnospiraceae bacterium]